MEKRVVIGARWLGREQKYGDYFDGYLAGLSVNFGEQIDEKVSLLDYYDISKYNIWDNVVRAVLPLADVCLLRVFARRKKILV